MKKTKLLFIVAAAGLMLTSCGKANELPLNFDEEDLVISTPWEDYHVPATEVKLDENQEDIVLKKGDSYTYKGTVKPNGISLEELIWVSSDEEVASVSKAKVSAKAPGSAIITVSDKGNFFEPISLNVTVISPIEGLTIDEEVEEILMDWEETRTLKLAYAPLDTTDRDVSWHSDNEDVATVVDGVVTAKMETGKATITVSSNANGVNLSDSIVVDVRDRDIPLDSIVLSGETGEVEAGKSLTLTSTLSPENATRPEVSYISEDEAIAGIKLNDGVVTVSGYKPGQVKVYAESIQHNRKSESLDIHVKSNEYTINVWEKLVTDIVIDPITLNFEKGLSQAIDFTYKTKRSDNEVIGENDASLAKFVYSIADEEVAKIVDDKLQAVAAGTTTLTIEDTRSGYSEDVAVTVDYSISSIMINEEHPEVKVGETAQLSVATVPAVPSSFVEWHSDNKSVATIDSNGVVTGVSVGEVHITASVAGHLSSAVTLTVNRMVTSTFEDGKVYLVGNADLSSGYATGSGKESPDQTSWGDSTKAYLFTEVRDPDTGSDEVQKLYGEVYLRSGDEVKVRYDSSSWLDPYEVNEDGSLNLDAVHYEKAGAIANDDIALPEGTNGNLLVKTTGLYEIYYKVYASGWHGVYMSLHKLHASANTVYVKPSETADITFSSWNGTLDVDVIEADKTKIGVVPIDEHGNYKITAGASAIDGYATIIAKDDIDEIEIHVYVSNADVDNKFKEGQPYIVGNKTYVGGESNTGASWNEPTLAFKMNAKAEPDEGVTAQWDGTITFKQGDEWRFRLGEVWMDINNIERSGAIETGDMELLQDSETYQYTNVKVNVAGTYTIQFKQYGSGDEVSYGGYISAISEIKKVNITAVGLDSLTWADADSASLFVWNDETKEAPLGSFDACGGNLKTGSVSFTLKSGASYDRFIFFVYENSQVKQTIDMVCDIHEDGSYVLTVGTLTWESDKISGGVTLAKGEGGGEPATEIYAIHYTNDGVAWGDSVLTKEEGTYTGELLLAKDALFCINLNGAWLHFDALDEDSSAKASFEDAGEPDHNFKCLEADTYIFSITAGKVTISAKPGVVHELALASTVAEVTVGGTDTQISIIDKADGSTVSVKSVSPEGKVTASIVGDKVNIHPVAEANSVTVTVTDGVTDVAITVKVNAEEVKFIEGQPYIVGNESYSTGTSIEGESWGDPTLAYKMNAKAEPDEGVTKQWDATITFAVGDEWKVRIGPDDLDYIPLENIEWNGALFTGDMVRLTNEKDEYTNIQVKKAGTYTIQFKQYGEGDLATYGIYISNLTAIHEATFTVMGLENIAWRNDDSESLYLWDKDDNPILADFDSCNGNLAESGSIKARFADGKEIAGAIFFFWEGDVMFKTEDIDISIDESGNYKIVIASTLDIDAEATEGVKTIHDGITIAERSLTLAASSAALNVGGDPKQIAIIDKAAEGEITVTSKDTTKVTAALNEAGDKVVLTPVAATTDPVKVEVKQGDVTREISVTVSAETPEMVTITLKSYADMGLGNRLYLVGDFCDWKINDRAIAFEWKTDHWEATVTMEKGTVYSCKIVKGAYENPNADPTAWEADPNRTITFDEDKTLTLNWQ